MTVYQVIFADKLQTENSLNFVNLNPANSQHFKGVIVDLATKPASKNKSLLE